MCSYSQAYFGAGTKLTVLDKNVKISEPVVKVLDVSEKEACQKTNITLVCLAESFYPDHVDVIWTVDGDNRTTDVSTDEAAIQNDETKFYSISSRLNINYKNEWTKGKKFTCTVRFYNGKEYTENSHFITGPKIEGDEERTEKYVLSVNTTMLAYGMFIAKSIAYGTFILYIIKRQPSVHLSCRSLCQALCQCASFADLKFGPGTRLTVLEPNMTITSPTVTMLPPSPKELCNAQEKNTNVTLVCLATDFYPDHVIITWQVNTKERDTNVATDHVAQQNRGSRFYSMSSRLHVNHAEWTNVKNNFTCIISFYNGYKHEKLENTITYSPVRVYVTVQFGYLLFIFKSLLYAVLVSILVWMCKATKEKTLVTENGDIMIN
ncbi:hypothetical protein KOW79_008477 [Hemibagrus wyckioides]|uniref:Ig-like domain-containing protein n=1 Tax=Hemibagrus wyckioides TaxID=337641 RepID=A0A9D3SR75_9TELE|nr:hypothetical protein KOW79_008477 [Hemibagrus wyckioides]